MFITYLLMLFQIGGNEQSCHMEQNQLRCICKTGYQGDKCENGGE